MVYMLLKASAAPSLLAALGWRARLYIRFRRDLTLMGLFSSCYKKKQTSTVLSRTIPMFETANRLLGKKYPEFHIALQCLSNECYNILNLAQYREDKLSRPKGRVESWQNAKPFHWCCHFNFPNLIKFSFMYNSFFAQTFSLVCFIDQCRNSRTHWALKSRNTASPWWTTPSCNKNAFGWHFSETMQ